MNLVWHIVRKDFVRLRTGLAAWLVLLLAKYAVGLSVIFGGVIDRGAFAALEDITQALTAAEVIATMLLAAMLVQEDGLVRTTEFWKTRPISNARLLRAKSCGLALLLALPAVVVALPWWLVCGFDVPAIARGAVDMLLLRCVVMLPAVAVATLTDSLGRFVVWAVVTALALAAAFLSMSAVMSPWGGSAMVVAGSVLAGMLVTVVMQYRARSRVRAIAYGVGGLAVTFIAIYAVMFAVYWMELARPPRPDFSMTGVANSTEDARTRGITVEFRGATVTRLPARGAMRAPAETVGCEWQLGGIPKGYVVLSERSGASWHQWSWPGHSEQTHGWVSRGRGFYGDPVQLLLGLRDDSDAATRANPTSFSTTAPVTPAVASRIRAEPPRLRVAMQMALARAHVRIDLPLGEGEWAAAKGDGLRIMSVEHHTDHTTNIYALESLSAPVLREFRKDAMRGQRGSGAPQFYLVNRTRGGRVFYPNTGPSDVTRTLRIGGVQLRGRSMQVYRMNRDATPDSLATSQLVLLSFERVAGFTRVVEVPRFEPK